MVAAPVIRASLPEDIAALMVHTYRSVCAMGRSGHAVRHVRPSGAVKESGERRLTARRYSVQCQAFLTAHHAPSIRWRGEGPCGACPDLERATLTEWPSLLQDHAGVLPHDRCSAARAFPPEGQRCIGAGLQIDKRKELLKMTGKSLLTTVVGSYPQPEWLIDRKALISGSVPRIRASGLWRIPAEHLEEAQDDATLVAIRDMQRAGVDIITDGEIRRESYSNRFATALEGVDIDRPGHIVGSSGRPTPVPRVVGPIRRVRPVQVRDVQFLRANTDGRIKATIPGPFTMAQQAQNEYYPDRESLAMDYASCVNEEVKELFAAGADVVQLDEPWVRTDPDAARKYGVIAINKALEGISGTTALHLCFGYAAMVQGKPSQYAFLTELEDAVVQQISIEAAQPRLDLAVLQELPTKTIVLGVLDLSDMRIETPEGIAARLREALRYVPPARLMVAPDCGMKYLPRAVAYRKLQVMTLGAAIVRASIG